MIATATVPGRSGSLVVGIDVTKSRLDASAGAAEIHSFAKDAEGEISPVSSTPAPPGRLGSVGIGP